MNSRPHVWIVGFPRCGSASLCGGLRILGWNPIHNPRHWDQLEGHDAAGDAWITAHWWQLRDMFPGSRFILNTRDLSEWLKSLKRIPGFWRSPYAYDRYLRLVVYGADRPTGRELKIAWEKHHAQVRLGIQAADLLELPLPFSWERLCGFLDVPVPDQPFPWLNRGSCQDAEIRLGR